MKTHATQKLIKNAILLGLTPLLLRLAAPSAFAQAGPYYWDNLAGAGFGTAGGTWSATTAGPVPGWNTDATGTATPGSVTTATTDVSENFGSAVSNLLGGTVTVSGTVNSGPIAFGTNSGSIVLSGGTITLPATATITVSNSSADTINSILAGAATSLTIGGTVGSGSLTLGGANAYTGSTLLAGPRVVISAASQLPSSSAVTISSGAQLYTSAGISLANNFTISGIGYNDASGVNAGAIRLVNGDTLSGTITLAANAQIGDNLTAAGFATSTISGQITGNFGLTFYGYYDGVAGTNTFTLANTGTANNYTGNTTVYNNYSNGSSSGGDNSVLKLGANEQIPNGVGDGILVLGGYNANRRCTFELNGYNETVNGITNLYPAGALWNVIQNTTPGASTLTIGDGNTTSGFSGNIIDGGVGATLALVKIGAGNLTLSGTNSYIGGTTINAGSLETDASPSPLGGGPLVLNGGALSNNVSTTLTNSINVAVNSIVGVGTSQTFTLAGIITNTGSLNLVGPGTLVLSNASSSYSGGTTISNGTLSLKNVSGFGTGPLTVGPGGVAYNFSATAATITNAVILNGGLLHTGGGNAGTKNNWSGPVTLTASSSVESDGTTLGNSFTGGLNLGNSGYTFTVNGNGNGGNNNNFNSVISGGPNATFITGAAGVAELNAANTFSGTNRSGYSIVLQNANAMQDATLDMNTNDSGSVTLINNAVIGALTGGRNLNLNVASISIGNNNLSTTFSGSLTNTGAIIKIGTGTLTLSGTNTYTGNTTISGGALALSGSGSLASPVVIVAGGATLDVSGESAMFALASGQTLANSGATTATLNGSANTGSGKVTLAYASGTPSFQVTGGTLTLSGSTTFTVSNSGVILPAGSYTIIQANGGTVAGTLPAVVVTGNGAVGLPTLSLDGSGDLVLNVQSTGWSGAVSTSWTTAGNWSSGTVPNPGDPINFNSSSTMNLNTVLNANFGISTLTVTVPTGPVSIAPGGAYTLAITNGINLANAEEDLTITVPVALGASQIWSVTNTHTLSVNGGVSGSAALTVAGGGKVVLGGAATYTGDTTVATGGTLQMAVANVLPNGTGAGNLNVSGAVDLNGTAQAVNGLTGGGIVDNSGSGAATLTVGNNNVTTNFTGVLQNTGGTLSLFKMGSGGLTLAGTNTFRGGITLSGGNLTPAGGYVFGSGGVTVDSGADLYPVASMTITNAIDLNGGEVEIGGGNSHQLTCSGPVSVTANNSLVSADGGTGYSSGYAYSSSVFLSGGLDMGSGGYNLSIYCGQYSIDINSPVTGANGTLMDTVNTLYLNGTNTFAGTIRSTNSNSVVVCGLYGVQDATLDLNAADAGSFNFINQNITIGGLMGSRNQSLGSGRVSVGNNNASTEYDGVLSGGGSLTKIGTGTLTLTGANLYSGPTTINAGTLALSGSGSLASSLIVLTNGAVFDVSGETATYSLGSQTLSNSAPGAILGGSNNTGSGTLALVYDGVNPSFVVTNGTLTLSASTTITVNNTGATLTPGTYKIIAATTGGSVAGALPSLTMASVVNGPMAGTPALSIVNGELYLTVGGSSTLAPIVGAYTYNGSPQGPTTAMESGSTAPITYSYAGTAADSTTWGPTPVPPTKAGSYTVTATVAADANYFGTTANANFTIGALALTFTGSKTYDGTATATAAQLAFGNNLDGANLTMSGTVTLASATVGSPNISSFSGLTLGGPAAANYTLTGASGSVTITAAVSTATVTVNNSPVIYNGMGQMPTLTLSGTNTVGLLTNILTGGQTLQTNAGTYAVTATFVPADTNYTTLAGLPAGNFTINPATTTAFAGLSPATNSYGVTNLVLTGTVSAGGSAYPASGETVTASINGIPVNGTVTNDAGAFYINYNDPSLATNGVAGSPYPITYNYAGNGNLGAASDASTALTITNAPLTITASNYAKCYGETLSFGAGSTAFSSSGLVNGETIGSVTLTATDSPPGTAATDAAGTYDLAPSAATGGTFNPTNYLITYINGALTVNPAPVVSAQPASSTNCVGSAASFTVGTSDGSDLYQWYADGVALTNGTTGNGSTIYGATSATLTYSNAAAADTVTNLYCVLTSPSGCAMSTTNVLLTVNPLPNVYNVTGGGGYCAGGPGVDIALDGSDSGVTYTLYGSTNNVVDSVDSTGGPVDFGPQTVADTYTVVASVDATGCAQPMNGSATVTINPAPAAPVTTGGSSCGPGPVSLSAMLGTPGDSLTWYSDAGLQNPVATGTSYTTPSLAVTTTYYVTETSPSGCASPASPVTATVNPVPVVSGQPASSTNCAGSTASFTVTTSDGSDLYQWYTNGVALTNGATGNGSTIYGATSATLTYSNAAAADTVTNVYCVLTSPDGCAISTTNVSLTVNALPNVYNVTGGGSYCAGGPGVDIALDGSDSGVTYTLYGSTNNVVDSVDSSGGPLDFGPQAVADTYTVVASVDATGCAQPMNGSATVTVSAEATASAGGNQTIYAVNSTAGLGGAVGGGATGGLWSSSGTGTFSPDATTLNATYTPSLADDTAGTVTLTLTSTGQASPCGPATVQVVVTINPLPVVLTGTRLYDGTATAAYSILTVSNAAPGDDVSVASGSATLASSWVGTNPITSAAGLTLGGSTAPKYTLTGASGAVVITDPGLPFSITSVKLDNTRTNLVLTWNAVPGVDYQLLNAPNLPDPAGGWVTDGSPISATNSVMSTTRAVTGGAKYYRLEDTTQ